MLHSRIQLGQWPPKSANLHPKLFGSPLQNIFHVRGRSMHWECGHYVPLKLISSTSLDLCTAPLRSGIPSPADLVYYERSNIRWCLHPIPSSCHTFRNVKDFGTKGDASLIVL